MNGPMFLAYVEQCLVPTLKRGDIVVMAICRCIRCHITPLPGEICRNRAIDIDHAERHSLR